MPITKSMTAEDIIKDFIDSDAPQFAGKSKEERKKMALGAYYKMHPEKSNESLATDEEDNKTYPKTYPTKHGDLFVAGKCDKCGKPDLHKWADGSIKCDSCGAINESEETEETRTIERHWKCDKCGKVHPPQMALVRFEKFHNRLTNKQDWRVKGYKCLKCDESLATLDLLHKKLRAQAEDIYTRVSNVGGHVPQSEIEDTFHKECEKAGIPKPIAVNYLKTLESEEFDENKLNETEAEFETSYTRLYEVADLVGEVLFEGFGDEYDEPTTDFPACPQCGGEGHLLGNLGKTYHFRCRGCGWNFHKEDEKEGEEE